MLRVFIGAICGLLLAVSSGRADEVSVPLDKVPQAVLDAVKKRFPKAELKEAAKETDGDKVEFEVSLMDGTTKYDVMSTPEGKLTLIEKTVASKDLPPAVLALVEGKYPKCTIKVAEEMYKVTDGGRIVGLLRGTPRYSRQEVD